MPLTQPPHHRTLSPQEEELQELLAELQRGLDGLAKGKLNATAKSERIAELSSRLQRAKQVLHSFKVELRDLARDRTAEFDIKAREFNQRVQTMQGELQHAKQEAERAQVGVKTLDEMTTQEVLQEAGKVQDQSLGALSRMKQQIAQTKEVGATTAVQLKAQTEQLKNIDTDIMKVKSNLTRADLLVRAFMRKIMTDKIIMSELAPARVRHQRREGRATRMGSGGPPCAGRLWRAPRQAPSACPAVARRASAIARVGYRARRSSRACVPRASSRACASCVVVRLWDVRPAVFMCLIFLGVIVIVVYKLVDPGGGGDGGGEDDVPTSIEGALNRRARGLDALRSLAKGSRRRLHTAPPHFG